MREKNKHGFHVYEKSSHLVCSGVRKRPFFRKRSFSFGTEVPKLGTRYVPRPQKLAKLRFARKGTRISSSAPTLFNFAIEKSQILETKSQDLEK